MQTALAKSKIKYFFDIGGFVSAEGSVMFGDLVLSGDTEIDSAFTYECWDVCGGQEDEGDGKVLDEGDVETSLSSELDVAAG